MVTELSLSAKLHTSLINAAHSLWALVNWCWYQEFVCNPSPSTIPTEIHRFFRKRFLHFARAIGLFSAYSGMMSLKTSCAQKGTYRKNRSFHLLSSCPEMTSWMSRSLKEKVNVVFTRILLNFAEVSISNIEKSRYPKREREHMPWFARGFKTQIKFKPEQLLSKYLSTLPHP